MDRVNMDNKLDFALAQAIKQLNASPEPIVNTQPQSQSEEPETLLATEALTSQQLEKVAQQLQTFVSEMNKSLEFYVHEESGRDVIQVIDKNSGELVKQYPSQEVLDVVGRLAQAPGIFIDSQV
ncbi:flagellar protein FlaG [Pseudoalteromonas sp. T1lg48]|uniref:flagellar protein FlaG n=1 Tax=Pseudoalteromonas sp. T1lg48 TaxID=2077100 RepID=UPI000CF64B9E|nr:flagellar protein FlaG [Pseudoalteromonas sp. T1lg48]